MGLRQGPKGMRFLMGEVPLYTSQWAGWCPQSLGLRLRAFGVYWGTALARKRTPPGPYRRPMPRALGGS